MVLNRAGALAALTGYRVIFTEGFSAAKPIHAPFCDEVTSTHAREEHHLPGDMAQLREWVGDRQRRNLGRFKYTLDNKKWELTVTIPEDDFEDDSLGLYNSQFRTMGSLASLHPDKLFAEALEAGFDEDGFDEVPFFATTHPSDGGLADQSNKGVAALDATAFVAGVTNLRKRKNRKGEPIDVVNMGGRLYLCVPPDLESTADGIVNVANLTGGASNPNYKKAEVIVMPRLTSTVKWYLMVGGGPLRPFINQMRRKPRLVIKDGPSDEGVFNRGEVEFGVDGRWNLGYGLWQLAYGSTGAGA